MIADCSRLNVSAYKLTLQNMHRKMTDSMDSPKFVVAMICQGDALVRSAPTGKHHIDPSYASYVNCDSASRLI